MKFLKALGLTLVLTCAAAIPASADDVSCIPGDIHGPPCTSAPATSGDSAVPGGVLVSPGTAESPEVAGADVHGGPWISPGMHETSSAEAGIAAAQVRTKVRPKAFRNFMVSP